MSFSFPVLAFRSVGHFGTDIHFFQKRINKIIEVAKKEVTLTPPISQIEIIEAVRKEDWRLENS